MSEAARAEVYCDPQPTLVIAVEVNVMVATTDSTELLSGKGVELPLWLEFRMCDPFEHGMVNGFFAFPTNAERNAANDFIHHTGNINVPCENVRANCFVSTGDIESDSREGNLIAVCYSATYWMAVTVVRIGIEHANVVLSHTALELLNGCVIDDVTTKNRNVFCSHRH
jgi:hypothetical protein